MSPLALSFSAQLTAFLVVYARIGTAVALMPALGETSYPARVRILFSLLVTLITLPAIAPAFDNLPAPGTSDPLILFPLLAAEITIGLFFVLALRSFLAAAQIFGDKFGFYAGLSNALAPQSGVTEGGTTVGMMIRMAVLALILATNTHHIMLEGVVRSYQLMPLGQPILGDMAGQMTLLVGNAFWLALLISAPFVVYSVLGNLALGLANRVMPTMQVFFVAGPALIIVGFLVLAITAPSMIAALQDALADWAMDPIR